MHLEPTYLRYIYDGLIKGSIHPENAAELDFLLKLLTRPLRTSLCQRSSRRLLFIRLRLVDPR
jgi:hypothetical protein